MQVKFISQSLTVRQLQAGVESGMLKTAKEGTGMQLGEVIRTYRKRKNMTQEEMANRLGVTAPAVNKWERGNSFPDITLLAPIARLLGITLDTLLAFRDEPTAEEIGEIICEADAMLKERPFEEALTWAKGKKRNSVSKRRIRWRAFT